MSFRSRIARIFHLDGRVGEALSGLFTVGWAVLADLWTDRDKVTASIVGLGGLGLPDWFWITSGYGLGLAQLAALMTLDRRLRHPIATVMGLFWAYQMVGYAIDTHFAPSLFGFGLAWAWNLYLTFHLLRRKPTEG